MNINIYVCKLMDTLFYMVYFKSVKPITTLNDFIVDLSCSVIASKPSINKQVVVNRVVKYQRVCIIYNALNQTYLNDQRHKKYDINVIRVLVLWAKNNIPQYPELIFGLEPIMEETSEELTNLNVIFTTI